ncbi:signal peptide peptidase-like 2B isoform X1 [Hydra vulgaris]|uniref:signal peptide peptidase-like 2B isoform X1 n=1 Tax=Hydra vulgaris TaxID=6087 RepID=UPI0006413F86|nr:signal peptide peptidase-like 2B isoform X1 [Hydra vulgaris]
MKKKGLQLLFAILLPYALNATFPLAILHLEGQFGSADVCAIYNPEFSAIPMELSSTPKYKVFVPYPPHGCSEYIDVTRSWNASSFVTSDGNCSQFEKFQWASYAHARQVIIVRSNDSTEEFETGTHYQHNQVHLSVGMISYNAWNKVQKLGEPIYSQLYHPHEPLFDPNIVIIWFIAVFTVCAGAYWSGIAFQQSGSKVIEQNLFDLDWTDDKKNNSLKENKQPTENDDDFQITTVMVVVFVAMICTVLLLLYFFYKYLIYVVIGLFSLATVSGTYQCLSKIMSFIECGQCRVPENKIPFLKNQPEVRNVLLLIGCIFLSLYWFIIRNSSYAWILQDFLGICFCISLIKMIKLPNLKISTILLIALLVYDIFFVFITPLFSARGKSVMVEVATGNGNKEQLPMVIKVPKMHKSPISLCERPYSLLGFGDILLPGIFVAFCHNFDVLAKTRYKVYFLATAIAYGLGLVITFIALILMEIGQPALLYLAPSVLIAATIVGVSRKEMRALWIGKVETQSPDSNVENFDEQRLLLDNP